MIDSGILLHISSLPSKYGIGDLGEEAYKFVNFLAASGQKYWQILPINPPGEDFSPYQAYSAFAGNYYFLDLDELYRLGLITAEYKQLKFKAGRVDYPYLIKTRDKIFSELARHTDSLLNKNYYEFCDKNAFWLEDYALFSALCEKFGTNKWNLWDKEIAQKSPEAVIKFSAELKDRIIYYKLLQYLFYSQWFSLKKYANSLGVNIIGDLPIYVSYFSADVWAKRENFLLGEDMLPRRIAGVPPDMFSKTGQLWGNPVYDWEFMKEDGFSWWLKRLSKAEEIFDFTRIDHFIGFADYYSVPYGSVSAENGEWRAAYGKELFTAYKSAVKNPRIIAEDLGNKTPKVSKLLDFCGFPGMLILQSDYSDIALKQLKEKLSEKNLVIYSGTHDNDTVKAWYKNLPPHKKSKFKKFAGCKFCKPFKAMRQIVDSSNGLMFIAPLQDYLNMGSGDRMNRPGTIGGNWAWRLKNDKYLKCADIYQN